MFQRSRLHNQLQRDLALTQFISTKEERGALVLSIQIAVGANEASGPERSKQGGLGVWWGFSFFVFVFKYVKIGVLFDFWKQGVSVCLLLFF